MGFLYRVRTRAGRRGREPYLLYGFRNKRLRALSEILYGIFLVLLVVLPLAWIAVQGLGALSEVALWGQALWVSVKLCFCTGVLTVLIALPLAYVGRHSEPLRRGLGWVCTVPLAVSSLLILLGWRLGFPSWGQGPFSLFLGVVVVQSLVALPIVYRPLEAGFSRIPDEWYRLSASLGGGAIKTFAWVELPALRGTLASAFFLASAISIGEAGAVLLFPSEQTMNLTYRVYQQMSRYRFEEAYATATVLLLLTGVLAGATAFFQKEEAA